MPIPLLFRCAVGFLLRNLQIGNIFHHLLEVIHSVVHRLLGVGIHNLLHTLSNFCLQILGVKTPGVGGNVRYFHGVPYHFAGFQRIGSMHLHHILIVLHEFPVFLLLGMGQRLIQHLQFQCFLHIFAITDKENQLIAYLHTPLAVANPVVQICQFKRPLLPVFTPLEFFQDSNQLFYAGAAHLFNLITKDILLVVIGGNLQKFFKIILRLIQISHFQGNQR